MSLYERACSKFWMMRLSGSGMTERLHLHMEGVLWRGPFCGKHAAVEGTGRDHAQVVVGLGKFTWGGWRCIREWFLNY